MHLNSVSLIVYHFHVSVRCISNIRIPLIEGELRARELSEYLEQMKTTRYVWLSEDASALTCKVTYNPSTNEMVGLVLPTDKKTGCPKPFSFTATDADTIKNHLTQNMSTVAYFIMAQPLDESVPPFVLQMFGSDNKFTTEDVIKRWNFTKQELEK